MTVKFRHFLAIFLACFSLIIIFFLKIYAWYPFFVEHFYSRWIYLSISSFLRSSVGTWETTLGDWLFLISIFLVFFFIVRIVLLIWNRKYRSILNLRSLLLAFNIIAYNYIIFNILGGLNYKRIPLQDQLTLPTIVLNTEATKYFTTILEDKLNELAPLIRPLRVACSNFQRAKALVIAQLDTLKNNTILDNTADSTLILTYENPSIKRSIMGEILNKLGVAGYHHPFTGEAVINVGVPSILLPSVMLHEISHQIGYPKEEEATLVSYVMARYIPSPLVKYSVYLDIYLSLLYELGKNIPTLYEQTLDNLSPEAKNDVLNFQAYLTHNHYTISYFKRRFYANFFSFNATMQGIENKNKSLHLIIAYTKSRQIP